MNCIIVDDDPTSRKLIGELVKKTDWLTLVSSCSSAMEAAGVIKKNKIDLIFLDVEMPGITGFEFIENLNENYDIILITSNKDHAIEGYEHGVTDFLVKPVEYNRFLKACTKAKQELNSTDESRSFIFLKTGTSYVKLSLNDVLYAESMGDYVAFYLQDQRHLINTTMKETEQKLEKSHFMRIHRSYLINLNKIKEIEDNSVKMENNALIPVSRSYKKDLLNHVKLF